MMSMYFLIIIISFIVCIKCNSLLTGQQSIQNSNEFFLNKNLNHQHYHRTVHDMQTHDKEQWLRFMSDEPISYVGNVDRQHDESSSSNRRLKFKQHRKLLGKKHSFRRGQRHRNNKNGKKKINK